MEASSSKFKFYPTPFWLYRLGHIIFYLFIIIYYII